VGIVGFDDSAWATRCQPMLSTVRQPARLMGRTVAELVLRQITDGDEAPEGILLDTEIVWRESA